MNALITFIITSTSESVIVQINMFTNKINQVGNSELFYKTMHKADM